MKGGRGSGGRGGLSLSRVKLRVCPTSCLFLPLAAFCFRVGIVVQGVVSFCELSLSFALQRDEITKRLAEIPKCVDCKVSGEIALMGGCRNEEDFFAAAIKLMHQFFAIEKPGIGQAAGRVFDGKRTRGGYVGSVVSLRQGAGKRDSVESVLAAGSRAGGVHGRCVLRTAPASLS